VACGRNREPSHRGRCSSFRILPCAGTDGVNKSAHKRMSHLAGRSGEEERLTTRSFGKPFAREPLGWLKGLRALTGRVLEKAVALSTRMGDLTGRFIKFPQANHRDDRKEERRTETQTAQLNRPPNRIKSRLREAIDWRQRQLPPNGGSHAYVTSGGKMRGKLSINSGRSTAPTSLPNRHDIAFPWEL